MASWKTPLLLSLYLNGLKSKGSQKSKTWTSQWSQLKIFQLNWAALDTSSLHLLWFTVILMQGQRSSGWECSFRISLLSSCWFFTCGVCLKLCAFQYSNTLPAIPDPFDSSSNQWFLVRSLALSACSPCSMAFCILGWTCGLNSSALGTGSSMKTGGPLKILLATIVNGTLLSMSSSITTFSKMPYDSHKESYLDKELSTSYFSYQQSSMR